MKLKDHPKSDGRRVWLTKDEVGTFLATASNTEQKIAYGLGVRCGLRVGEIVGVMPRDLAETGAGTYVRVEHGKGDKYRESPVPQELAATIDAYADVSGLSVDEPLIDCDTRSVQRWVESSRNELRAETKDEGWKYLTPHDLRRTWGTLLLEDDVEPGMVMDWGGWDNWETFREHYLGVYSQQKQLQEREKVSWL